MATDTERAFESAVRVGQDNAHLIEMARRHCLRMEFTESGGRGYAEEATGLPINMRTISCPVARGGASSNLALIVREFYESHCVGCKLRQPTGDVPNLATLIEEEKAEAAQTREAAEQRTQKQHAAWVLRVEHRRGLRVAADPAMASALDDIGALDTDPAAARDAAEQDAARRRLTVLAERNPSVFTTPVIDLAVRLVVECDVIDLLTPLRHLARNRDSVAPAVLAAALAALRRAPVPDAGRCLADLLQADGTDGLDAAVIQALIHLAEPTHAHFTAPRSGGAGDASGLRAAADAAPQLVAATLERMLPRPVVAAGLILPPGSTARPASAVVGGDGQRCAAASAIAALAQTHQSVIAPLAAPLLLSLGVDSEDFNDREPISTAQYALATMLVLGVGDVAEQLETAGRGAGEQVRERLFGVLERAERLIDPEDRWRTSRDPLLDPGRQRDIFDSLLSTALIRAGGDWGDMPRSAAARQVENLAEMNPAWARDQVPAILGTVLLTISAIEQEDQTGTASVLTAIDTTPNPMRFLERMTRQTMLGSTVQKLLRAIEHIAGTDPVLVCSAVIETIADERASERGEGVVWRLLPVLGEIGTRHGHEPAVLHAILPTLHTYLVDADVSLRSAALSAWSKIGAARPVPSSVADLLPALIEDNHIGVINAVLGAAMRLDWSDAARMHLFVRALTVCQFVDASQHTETLKKSMSALSVLARDSEELRAAADQAILGRAAELHGYDLQDVLRRTWLPATTRAPAMAALRLRQARDPRVNDRFNAGDDDELCALLSCGPGLTDLPAADLRAAALELAPDNPLGAAEFAEVAWRAARPADATAIMAAVLDATPDTPAYRAHRALVHVLAAAAAYDDALAHSRSTQQAAAVLAAAAKALDDSDPQGSSSLARQARLRITLRDLFQGRTPPTGLLHDLQTPAAEPGYDLADPAAQLRHRAQLLEAVAAAFKETCEHATPTAAYLRGFLGLCQLAAQLINLDAAELDADHTTATAAITAVRRRAVLLAQELRERFDEHDPLAGPLLAALDRAEAITGGSHVADTLTAWAALPLPIPVTRGPRRLRSLRQPGPPKPPEAAPLPDVAVVLASVDDRLITGPQVLRPSTVYELRLDVQPGDWPTWADVLEADLLSHFTLAEAETPTYSWPRPEQPEEETLSGVGTLILRFGLPPGRPAPPFLIRLRWRGTVDGQPTVQELDVAGHREIRFRPFDASRDFLTNFPVFDERLLSLYERLHQAGYDDAHLQAFCRLFTATCRAGLMMTWNKQYKRGTRVTERKFHDDLYMQLQAEPELGGRLERGSPLALGFLDVRHDGITAELKVERRTPVSEATAPKYMGQPTQYAAADGARLSILCILDMSTKTLPIGVPENYLFTLQPALHGLTNPEAPSLVAVIVVNGNLPTPSSWSRRRTAIQPQP